MGGVHFVKWKLSFMFILIIIRILFEHLLTTDI